MDTTSPSVAEQWAIIDRFNATSEPSMLGHCLHHLLQETADKYAQKTAVICGTISATYSEVDTRAHHLAQDLVARGIKPGDLVGIALDRSVNLIVALLAVLKPGAAYMPIDPNFPANRIRQMLDDAGPKIVILGDATQVTLSSCWKGACLNLDKDMEQLQAHGDSRLKVDVGPDDLAYVIYTSGSTGLPKGVEISHGALSNHPCALWRDPGCTEDDRLLAVTTVSFDIAALEIFLPLLCGAIIVLAKTHEIWDPDALIRLMQCHNITMMQAAPATWEMLLEAGR